MMIPRFSIFLQFALFLATTALRAEVSPARIGWQLAGTEQGKKGAFQGIAVWELRPRAGLLGRPRALVTLSNHGGRPAGAVVVRYAFSARLVKREGQGGEEGTWAVPFIVEERRVPQSIVPEASMDVPIYVNRVALDAFLKRIYSSGLWLDALRIQVMVEPRAGEPLKGRSMEATLPVAWEAKPAGGGR